jgi:hypothetical protein
MLDIGWAKHGMRYGGGLMIQWFHSHSVSATKDDPSTYIGHLGDTYGFQSAQGFFNAMNVSLSIVTNQDFDGAGPHEPFCDIVLAVSKYKGVKQNFTCSPVTAPKFTCAARSGDPAP